MGAEQPSETMPVIGNTSQRSPGRLSFEDLTERMKFVREMLEGYMEEDMHYGTVTGIKKPFLWKPGAELLCMGFQLRPLFDPRSIQVDDLPGGHLRVRLRCQLVHVITGEVWGESWAMCSTMESKYRYQLKERTCPSCGKEAIIKGRAEYGGGYVCFKRKDGCGAKFGDNDQSIVGQEVGKMEIPDLADKWHTITMMAEKRAFVAATLVATASSEFFTQEDATTEHASDLHAENPQPQGTQERKLTTQPKPETPAETATVFIGTILSVTITIKGYGRLLLRTEDGEKAMFFDMKEIPAGMPAQAIGGGWAHLQGKACTAKFIMVTMGGQTTRFVKEVKVELLSAGERKSFDDMKSKHGVITKGQQDDLLHEMGLASLVRADFDAFLGTMYGHTLETLPTQQFPSVKEQLKNGFATEWCLDQSTQQPAA